MGFKFVLLWTDVALWLLFAALGATAGACAARRNLRATWRKVLRDPAALCSAVVLLLFLGHALDSVHFRRAAAVAAGQAAGKVFYDTRTAVGARPGAGAARSACARPPTRSRWPTWLHQAASNATARRCASTRAWPMAART
jgi:hypothetical protein